MEQGYSANILVVGDNSAHSLAIEAALDGEPYRFVRACSGSEAVRCLLREEIAVILIGVHLSGMSGFETAGFIKSYSCFKSIPVIFISESDADADQLAAGYAVGAIDYLSMPLIPYIFKAKIKELVSLCRDRTALSQQAPEPANTNRQLAQEEVHARVVMDASIDAMLVLDASGVILEANRAAAGMFGYDKGELIGLHISLLFPSAISMDVRSDLPFGKLLEMEPRRKDGTSFPAEVHWSISAGIPGLLACTVRDIARRKQSEREWLEAKEEAERIARARMEFLTFMSPEIRTPLNGIIGMMDLLKDSGLTSEQSEMAEIVSDNGHALLKIVNDVLDLSRIEAGRMELEQELFLLEDCLDGAGKLFMSQMREKRLSYTFAVEPGVPEFVRGDRFRLQQILANLIGNSIKFTEKGGVDVKVSLLEETEERIALEFVVKDTGMGIAADEIDRLFLPFSQANVSTTRKYGGSGLGLSICKTLCELMEGNIRVEPSGEPGTVFVFSVRFGKIDRKAP
ncbi:ATP-binding protein [Cohnella sp. GbtcB17]|uniref:ATP-binding response regulator n=1 Tax=Cohnella sp. GbtcB17 TaxID=2824762 RepID=UPI001C2F7A10